jgi:hypothetical protein
MRCKINAAAKPSYRLIHTTNGRWHFKIADIHVDDRHHRVVWMNDDRYARSKKIILILLATPFSYYRAAGHVQPKSLRPLFQKYYHFE